VAALRAGAFAEAAASLSAHLRQVPNDVAARHLLAEATLRLGRADDARAALEQCLAQAPDFAAARHSLAMMLYANGRYADAIPHLARLLDRAPDEYGLRALLAGALVHLGDDAGAIPIYEAMLAESRGQPHVWLFYGHALKAVGREREAVTAYRACLELYPTATGAYLSLADVKTASFTDAELDAMAALLRRPGLDGEDRARLHYALGAALERKASYADSFAHYAAGARLRRRGITYDPARTSAEVARMRALFTADFLARHAATGCPSAAPIFVLGMARAGSTLVEQILASHPAVEGTMELAEIGRIAADLRGPDETYAARLRTADAAMLRRLGERYIAQTLQVRRLGRSHFIDKMPANVTHIGLIHLILPRARIIDVRRRPMAAGFAVFKQYFQDAQDGQDYSYDLAEIGRYYRDYVALTAHFDEVLPGRVHLVRYEALVTDTETEVRRMLDYCGLPFDPACLRFWETARAVQTPSAQQVRQPIFRDALEQWRHYAPWLGPLRDALGPLADA
jgi:tetratricopeptide (TPR) repeat protein